jgi:electron transfer flavoprotein beta subunit
MKIAVCVKQVPDTWAEKTLLASDSTLDREGPEGVMNEIDEYAVEEALQLVEAHGGDVTVVTMGPAKAAETVRKALSMGVEAGIHLLDDALHGSDALATSYALAQVLGGRGFDLVIFGSESTDARMSVVPAMVAERLGWAQLTFAQKVEASGDTITIHRVSETGYDTIEGSLPAVVSVVETLSVADAGLDSSRLGLSAAWSVVADFAARPPKPAGTIVTDAGDGGVRIAEFLSEQKFI